MNLHGDQKGGVDLKKTTYLNIEDNMLGTRTKMYSICAQFYFKIYFG